MCETPRSFRIIAIHTRPDSGPPEEYTLASCERCSTVALYFREDMGDDTGFEADEYYRLWPPHDRHIGYPLPEIVRQSYEEAVRCEAAKAYLAAAVMVRRALEAITKEFEPSSKTLYAGIKAMSTKGMISQELADWGDQLRVIGNQGAHASAEVIDQQTAAEAIDFLQAMLEILYDLRPKFEKMRLRRASSS